MRFKKSLVEVTPDEGYDDSLLMHINNALAGKDMRAERIIGKTQAFSLEGIPDGWEPVRVGRPVCSAKAFEYETVKALCPQEIAAIESHAEFESWGNLAESLLAETTEEQTNVLVGNLLTAFNKATEVDGKGLTLSFTCYNKDNGGIYDKTCSHDDCIFEVQGTLQLTPAGEKFEDKTQDVSYAAFM